MIIKIKEDTMVLFEPFFKLRDFNKENKNTTGSDDVYLSLVKQCLGNFGKGKLSVNRPMKDNFGILCFIYDTDLNLFAEFCSAFGEKITENRKYCFALRRLVYEGVKDDMEALKLMIAFNALYGCGYEKKVLDLIDVFCDRFGDIYRRNKAFVSMLTSNIEKDFINNAISSCEDGKKRKRL